MGWGQNTFLIFCDIMNHPDFSGCLKQVCFLSQCQNECSHMSTWFYGYTLGGLSRGYRFTELNKTKREAAPFRFYAPYIFNNLPENCRSVETL